MEIVIIPNIAGTRTLVCVKREYTEYTCSFCFPSEIMEAIEDLRDNRRGWSCSSMDKREKAAFADAKRYSLEEVRTLLTLNPNYFKGDS